MASRIYFEEIDSSGRFKRTGDIMLQVRFTDEEGNEHLWFPEWNDLQNLYAEAERVEEINPTGEEDLKELKELKKFSKPIIDAIAEIIADTWQGVDLNKIFEDIDDDFEWNHHAEEHAATFPVKTGGPSKMRKDAVLGSLENLNEEDYQLVVTIIERVASPKYHIGKDDRRKETRHRLNDAIKHAGFEVTRDGIFQPIEYEEDEALDW